MTKKLIFHKGLTTKDPNSDVYIYSYVGLEYDVADEADEATVAQVLIRMRALVEQELTSPSLERVPEFDAADLDKLPWKAKGGEASEDGHWGWISGPENKRGTEPGAETLVKALEDTKDYKFEFGKYEYSFSKDKAFINRKPVKQESAK